MIGLDLFRKRADVARGHAEVLQLSRAVFDVPGAALLIAEGFEFRESFFEIHGADCT